MVQSRFLNFMLVFVTIVYLTSAIAEANRGFGWTWGWNSNHSSGSGSYSGSGSKSSWGWNSNHSSGSGPYPGSGSRSSWGWDANQTGSNWSWGWGLGGPKKSHNITNYAPRKIIVGGDKEWTYGVNYSDWAAKTAPFYVNDILVFKYNPPAPFTHSVYLLGDKLSYENCDIKKGKMIASPKQGAGEGFEFVIQHMCPYYFACGEHEGLHCNNGTMKFTVNPVYRTL